ncbi:MAG: family 2 glycosyl transferase [Candidatus Gottesmanbacteria bacterium GW2011_GWA2_43_14]|uniref:Family 2 glycosyl transferase n=1 Tax=Candidatus Gottesmanbacteria bacterium GW2011_GWA2_43_14 TaxID=1618443 RepID=A0A0G1DK58_9BACT|nr:MAG: family 2 glycosyl transferase [Candidatus Gottesmanbacteria bacterium GW2011_GWA2_43_14]
MIVPYFSVIIPALNEEKYLPTILKSLTMQTFKDFEVIVVDGNSRDKTVDVFNKFRPKLPYSKILVTKRANVGFQRNSGGKEAGGKYFIFLDADVDISSTFLEEIHLASIKKGFKLATTWIMPDSRDPIDQTMILLGNLGQELSKLFNKPFSGGYNTIVKKEAFQKLKGFREDMKINEDQDFAIRAFKKNIETVILQEPKVTYSLRRFRSEGTLQVLRKYAQSNLHFYLKGPITHELFEYRMGGHVHKRRRKQLNLTKIDTYIKAMEKLEDKIVALLSE